MYIGTRVYSYGQNAIFEQFVYLLFAAPVQTIFYIQNGTVLVANKRYPFSREACS